MFLSAKVIIFLETRKFFLFFKSFFICFSRRNIVILHTMIQLQRHIEILLLENECVIVPDFGGFMTHEVPARYDEADHSFLPPYRTLGFNPMLRMNDSLLVQSYIEAYDISYPEALRRIESEVKELKQRLHEKGQYTMEDLGVLTVNQEGNYEFAPNEAGVLSPELYGLGDFHFHRLKDAVAAAPVVEMPMMPVATEEPKEEVAQSVTTEPSLLEFTDSGDDANETLTIKMSWIRNTVAVAVAVVAFFLISTPITNSNINTQTMSNLQHHLIYKLIPQDTNVVPVAEPVEQKTAKKAADNKTIEQEKFYVVVASHVKKNNGEALVVKMQEQGYNQASLWTKGQTIRVISGVFDTETEAYQQIQEMTKKGEYKDAWVYKDKVKDKNKADS